MLGRCRDSNWITRKFNTEKLRRHRTSSIMDIRTKWLTVNCYKTGNNLNIFLTGMTVVIKI